MMAFLRVVEVLPPLFPFSRSKGDRLLLRSAMDRFAGEVRAVRDFADVVLVANVKDQSLLRVDPVHAAIVLGETAKVDAAPVVVLRGQSRSQFLSTVLTAVSIGLKWIMIAWGDDHPDGSRSSNARDYTTLATAIGEAADIRSRAGSKIRIFAPVQLESLRRGSGVALAKARLKAGADLLLAQPPTTDAKAAFRDHLALVTKSGLGSRVLFNVFHFKDDGDVGRYQNMFGWDLPLNLHATAKKGERALIEVEREVVARARREGLPGVYVSTRGMPQVVKELLS